MNRNDKILIVGGGDLVERSLCRFLKDKGFLDVVSSSDIGLDASVQSSVYHFFQGERPSHVILGPTRSGGIAANQARPADLMHHNIESQNNIIYASWKFGVQKLIFIAASCVYPRECVQPISEDALLTGPLEPTGEAYATARIAGIQLCRAFRRQYGLNAVTLIPATVYGATPDGHEPSDPESMHVMEALITRFRNAVREGADSVSIWGTGTPRREFLYVDDFCEAVLWAIEHYHDEDPLNVGCGEDISISELAREVAQAVGFNGTILTDPAHPDGTPQKLFDSSRINQLGWKAKVSLRDGIRRCCS